MEGNGEAERDRNIMGENSAAEGDGERGSMMRCASQSSLDESSQRPATQHGAAAQHASKLLAELNVLRLHRALCDVQLQAQPEQCLPPTERQSAPDEPEPPRRSVGAHRAVLAACSPYFRAMFTQFDERTQDTITIQNVDPDALELIVEYIYSPESLIITEDNVQSVLSAASLLQVSGARAASCVFLAAALCADNALGIRAFADLHACTDLAQHALRYIHTHTMQVLETEEFLALSADSLAELLESDQLTVPNEEVILDAVIRWIQHEPTCRLEHLGRLLERVRLPLVSQDALLQRVAQDPLRAADVIVKDLVIEALSFHLMRPERRAALAAVCSRVRPRHPPASHKILLVVGGQAPKAIREVEAYHLECGRWVAGAELPSRRCRAGLAVLDNKVYAIGGFNGTLRVRSVDVWEVGAEGWVAGPPLGARRSTLGVAVLGGLIYAIGGFDGANGLSSAEVLDPRTGVWRPIASMSSRRSSVGVGVLNNKIYAVGGYDGGARQCLHTVERYDPVADRWERAADMAARRSGAGVGAVGGALYAVGGHDGPLVRPSVEAYREPAGWAPAPHMHVARRNAGVAAHGGRLYVVGGDDGTHNLASVEVYDPAQEQWSQLAGSMSLGRSYAGVCCVARL